jgi:hypothetical protein
MTLRLTATEMGSTYDAAITVSIDYTDPCSTQWPAISLGTFNDMVFGLFELELASQTATFTTVTDEYSCTASCGDLVATLTFASDADASGLSAAVSMTGLALTIDTSQVDATMISENTVTLTITYANCATSTDSLDFELDIVCTTGSDIALTDGSNTDLTFNFITDTSLTTTFTYTHSYCDPHTVTF